VNWHSALDPAGPQAAAIFRLWHFMLPVATLVYAAVVGALVLILLRRRPFDEDPRSPLREAAARRAIAIGIAATVVIAFVTLVYDFAIGRNLMAEDSPPALTIRVTGHQWWWEVEYEDSIAQNRAHLANELHIPVGRPIRIRLVSHDVIHSFWMPNLGGKKDLIPGHDNEIWVRADRPGVYRGQCAEFCGIEHAKMTLFVVAEPPDRFSAWLARQREPARTPNDSLASRGRLLFEGGSCAMCHTVESTLAGGRVGPDLTHVASRIGLAAGAVPNTPGNLAGWIIDPQTIKPGALMPSHAVAPLDLRALVAYLETLQ
jgi:cytochrome c oxidase subunit 2